MFASDRDMELPLVVKEECRQPSDERIEHSVYSVYSVHEEHNYAFTTTNTLKTNHDPLDDDLISEREIKVEVDSDDLENGNQSECVVNAGTMVVDSENKNQSKGNRVTEPNSYQETANKHSIYASADFKTIIMKTPFPLENPPQELIVKIAAGKKVEETEVDNKTLNTNDCSFHVYSCIRCLAKFLTSEELKIHKRVHRDDVYKCDKCEYTSKTKQKLKSHQDVHRSVFYRCEFCGKIIEMLHNLKTHIKVKHNIEPKSSYPEMEDNCTGLSINKSYPCVVCAEEFKTDRLLRNHMRTHKRTCPKCQKTLTNSFNLKQHMLTHFYEDHPKVNTCKKCNIDYTDIESLKHHMNLSHPMDTMPDPQIFACNVCNKMFPSEYHLHRHENAHKYNKRKRELGCNLCYRVFKRRDTLEAHKLAHVGQKPYLCEKCGFTFVQRKTLNHHMRMLCKMNTTQEETTPKSEPVEPGFQCPKCGKLFSCKSHLYSHEYGVHAHREATCCELCGKIFNSARRLKVHMQRHGQEFNYSCNICSKMFKTRDNLRQHMSVHTVPQNIRRERRRARYEKQIQQMVERAENAKANYLQVDENKEENTNKIEIN